MLVHYYQAHPMLILRSRVCLENRIYSIEHIQYTHSEKAEIRVMDVNGVMKVLPECGILLYPAFSSSNPQGPLRVTAHNFSFPCSDFLPAPGCVSELNVLLEPMTLTSLSRAGSLGPEERQSSE